MPALEKLRIIHFSVTKAEFQPGGKMNETSKKKDIVYIQGTGCYFTYNSSTCKYSVHSTITQFEIYIAKLIFIKSKSNFFYYPWPEFNIMIILYFTSSSHSLQRTLVDTSVDFVCVSVPLRFRRYPIHTNYFT